METHLFELKRTAFILWRPRHTQVRPKLVLGQFQPGNPPALANRREFELQQMPEHTDLWGISAGACGLTDGQVYHYWFEVTDSSPIRNGRRILCTDPTAFTVDWRLLAPTACPRPTTPMTRIPAAVVKFANGELVACDPAGETFAPAPAIAPGKAQPNNRIVIYELPTSWARINVEGDPQIGVGTFRDVLALVGQRRDAGEFRRQYGALEPRSQPSAESSASTRSNSCRSPTASWIASGVMPRATTSRRTSTSAFHRATPRRPQARTSSSLIARLPRPRHPLHHRRGDGLRHARGAGERQLRRLPHRPGRSRRTIRRPINRAGRACATASAVGCGATRALFPATTRRAAQAAISPRPAN